MADEFGDINAVGDGRVIGRMGSTGGNSGKGPLGQTLPTGNLTEGPEWSRDTDMNKGARADMSISKNRSISKRSMGSR